MSENCEVKRMGYDKETIKKKIVAFSVVAACLQFIKHVRNSRVSNTRKWRCCVKPLLAIMD